MPQPLPAGLRLGIIEPADAAATFARRGLLQPSYRWQDVWQDEHARAFAVAGMLRLDVLELVRSAIDQAIAEGTSLADFQAALQPQLAAKGFWGDVEVTDPETDETRVTRFDPRRLQLIYDINLRQSRAAGTWARIERTKDRFPLVMYRTMHDERVRATHRPWDGVVLPVDHAWWSMHFPPNGWRCRCTAFSIDHKGIDRLRAAGQPVKTEAPVVQWITYVNPRTGQVAPVPRGVDPGFAYNPGQQRDQAFFDAALAKAQRSSPLAAAVVLAQAQSDHGALVRAKSEQFAAWAVEVLRAGKPRGEVQFIGALKPQAVRELAARGLEPASAVLSISDAEVLHALRPAKGAAAVDPSVFLRLPELLARAEALLLDKSGQPALLYVVDLGDDGRVAKLVVQLDYQLAMRIDDRKATVQTNLVRTVTVMDPSALRDRTRYDVLWSVP